MRTPVAIRAEAFDCVLARAASRWCLVVIAVGVLLYVPFLGLRGYVFEEGRRAIQAVAMVEGGSWWHLDVAGERYVSKPPLLPWLIALSSFVTGGVNEAATRLPAVIAIIVIAVVSGALARLIAGEGRRNLAALAAGMAVLCSPYLISRGRLGETDTTVAALVGVAFFVFAAAYKNGSLGLKSWTGVTAALVGVALAKGPIPVAFAVVPILAVLVRDRALRQTGAALAATVVSLLPLGFWAFHNLDGPAPITWLREMRLADTAARLPTADFMSLAHFSNPPLFLAQLLPWVLFAAAFVWRTRDEPDAIKRAFVIYATVMPVIVLLWPMGRGRYALPAIVPIASLAGAGAALYCDRPSIRRLYFGLAMAIAVVGLVKAFAIDGRTQGQRAFRADLAAFRALIADAPDGRILFPRHSQEVLNLLVYGGMRVRAISVEEAKCPMPTDRLVWPRTMAFDPLLQKTWRELSRLPWTNVIVYAPTGSTGDCSER